MPSARKWRGQRSGLEGEACWRKVPGVEAERGQQEEAHVWAHMGNCERQQLASGLQLL